MDDQNLRNQAEWEDQNNWSSPAWFYLSRQDRRLWVPKRITRLGWTVNLGHRWGAVVLLAAMLWPILVLLLVIAALISAHGSPH